MPQSNLTIREAYEAYEIKRSAEELGFLVNYDEGRVLLTCQNQNGMYSIQLLTNGFRMDYFTCQRVCNEEDDNLVIDDMPVCERASYNEIIYQLAQ